MQCIRKAFVGADPDAARTADSHYRTSTRTRVESPCQNRCMAETAARPRPIAVAVFLVIAGALGLLAAYELSLEKILSLEDPAHIPSCNVGVLVGCSTNLASWQGSVFGFPNPFLGLMAWPVLITSGVALLSGARFARWYWVALNIGVAGALVFVGWLIYQSIYVLDVLCPWCMLTWAVTIPTFWVVTLHVLRSGFLPVPAAVRRRAHAAMSWIVVITVVSYAVVVVLAQARMNALPRLLLDLQNLWA